MFTEQIILQLITVIGVSGVILLLIGFAIYRLALALAHRMNAHTRQVNTNTQTEEIVNSFVVKFNDEIRDLRQENRSLLDKFHETDKELAREQGRRDEIQKQIESERQERRNLKDEIQKQNVRILELERHGQESKKRISELEAEIALLNKQLTESNKENALLQAQKRELEILLEKETNRANTLSELISRLQAPSTDTTQALPDIEDTVITDPQPVTTGNDATENDNEDAA